MSEAFDTIVIGAGPGGAEAALTAAGYGHKVALIDEQPAAGGQIWRAPAGSFPGKGDAEARAGEDMRRRLAASAVTCCFGHRVWMVGQSGAGDAALFSVDALGPEGPRAFASPSLVVATGAHERVVPFPGWTLPGVLGLAAATVLLKSHGVSPGQRVVIAGCGPLLPAVAAGLVRAGVELLAVADLAPSTEWLARLPAILSRPRLAMRGAGWLAQTRLAGVPYLAGHGIRRAEGVDAVNRVVLGPVDQHGAPIAGPERAYDIDALIVGHGLTMANEITGLLRAEHRFERLRGGWVPVVDAAFRTSIPGLFAIGDGAGIRGQEAASLAGRRVGIELGFAIGALQPEDAAAARGPVDAALARLAPFSDAIAGLMAQRPAQVAAIEPGTIVCRCEEVTRREIDAAIAEGADEINQLKHFTRAGMGPCQGRFCGDTIQELLAQAVGKDRASIGSWTGRPPLRPVALGDLIGRFDYGDIPIPEPAPL